MEKFFPLTSDEELRKCFPSCMEKQEKIIHFFNSCTTSETKYQRLIEIGASLPVFPKEFEIQENIVQGCQSTMYLHTSFQEHQVIFLAGSEALISAGLAALLIGVYSGEAPETILKCPPSYIAHLGLRASLTPGRSNGLYSMHLRMKQEALKLFIIESKN